MNTKEINKAIILVAGPTMIQMFLETSYHIINAIWIGMLGSIALAASASSSFFLWMIFSCCSLIEVGINSSVARSFGAKDKEAIEKVSIYGIRYAIFIGFIVSLIGIFFIEKALSLVGLDDNVLDSALCILYPTLIALPIFTIGISIYSIFRGIGDTKTPLKILSSTLILNGFLDPLLIFGYFSFPALGIAGAPIATIICQIIAISISLLVLKQKGYLTTKISLFKLELKYINEISKVGMPIAFNGVIFCIVYVFITNAISRFGTAPIAALGIGHRIESLGYCISLGFSIAATTLVGQSIGEKNRKKAVDTAYMITYYATGVLFVISILILIFKENIAGIFSSDPEVIKAASGYLTAIGYTEMFLATEIVLEGVFSGLGNTLPTTIIGLPLNLLRVPMAYFLSNLYGVDGVWWTIG